MNLAVILLSEQPIPNVLFLKDFYNEWDKILVIGTKKTQERNYTQSALSIFDKKDYNEIIVDENDLSGIVSRLEEFFLQNSFDKILVNITGGTKVMALAAYDFFKNNTKLNSTIYYKPIDKNSYFIFYPKTDYIESKCRLSIPQYTSAMGIKIKRTQEPDSTKSKISQKLFVAFMSDYETVIDITKKLRAYRSDEKARKKILNSADAKKAIKDLVNYCKIEQNELDQFDFTQKDTVVFFTGGWFEHYVFDQLKKLPLDDIKCNIEIVNENNSNIKNELDVAFTFNNTFHIIECKTGEVKDFITDTIYKASQIRQKFGLSAVSHLIILNPPDDKISQEKKERAEDFKLYLIDYEMLKQRALTDIFREKLKL